MTLVSRESSPTQVCHPDKPRHTRARTRTRGCLSWLLRGALAFLCAACVWSSVSTYAFAASGGPISIRQISVGFQGYYSKQDWIPVTVRIYNTGKATSATLVVPVSTAVDQSSRMAYGKLQWPVWLNAHGWTTKQVMLPGTIVGSANLLCDVDGSPVSSAAITGNALGDVALVAVLANKVQAAQSLMGSEDGASGAPVLPVTIDPHNFPSTVNALTGLTALVATPETLASLSKAQSDAVQEWVSLGGVFVVIGTQGVTSTWQNRLPILPANGTVVHGDSLETFIGASAAEAPRLTVYASKHSLQPGASSLVDSGGVPLLAQIPDGRGTIVQTSFSPSEPSLLAWTGNAAFWTTVFKTAAKGTFSTFPNYLSGSGVFSLTSASDALAPLRVPSLRFWASLFAIYVLVVGPGLFFVLRRFKKETAAWVILPAVSVLVTVGIYGFGATQRPTGLLTEGTGFLDLVGNGSAQAYGVRALMSPRVTSVQVNTKQPMLSLALIEQNNSLTEQETVTTGGGTAVSFDHVARWGVRYAYLAGAVEHQGSLEADLTSASGELFGSVQNNTPYTLNDVMLFWDKHTISLGDLKPGASVTVDMQSDPHQTTTNWLGAYSAYNRDISRSIGRSIGSLAATEQWLNSSLDPNTAMIVATTTNVTPAVGTVQASEQVSSDQTLTLVRQFVSVTPLGPLRGISP
ncbi:hypothetical protein JI721_13540 [Alicyclobacillus cycloheptanicus]|uniref:Uncharacterized protein n=1 Tax=Alicyclobacillus cycloheptanicus TaxID=1457 RepID=A0ABT9XFU2_9BACL|nr:hypothetical protein [Alicyclobacillus cycloheptanicus]MDQ0188611.1 hypothetical protein [Alicyclobacillus cycloheptanicus]WDM00706.1 hypothetical protein JI721_13540 [Alicyclobacillus cycloheptanicus]